MLVSLLAFCFLLRLLFVSVSGFVFVVCVFGSLVVLFAFLYVFDVCVFVIRVSCVCVLVRCFFDYFPLYTIMFVFVFMLS